MVRNKKPNGFLDYESLSDKICLIEGNICDREIVERIISEEKIDIVFHLAAQVEVGVALENPFLTYETNIRGTYSILETIRKYNKNIQAVIIASSDKSYGSYPLEKMPYSEDYPLVPKYPYDVSKAATDLISQSYASEIYKLPIIITRFCNIYGPGQLNYSAIVPDAITSAQKYKTFLPRGDGSQLRDFIYVEDVSLLYMKIAANLSKNDSYRGEIYNAGTNKPISIKDLVSMIFKKVGNIEDLEIVIREMIGQKTVGEIDTLWVDKLNNHFKWSPQTSLSQGLTNTIEWLGRIMPTEKTVENFGRDRRNSALQ